MLWSVFPVLLLFNSLSSETKMNSFESGSFAIIDDQPEACWIANSSHSGPSQPAPEYAFPAESLPHPDPRLPYWMPAPYGPGHICGNQAHDFCELYRKINPNGICLVGDIPGQLWPYATGHYFVIVIVKDEEGSEWACHIEPQLPTERQNPRNCAKLNIEFDYAPTYKFPTHLEKWLCEAYGYSYCPGKFRYSPGDAPIDGDSQIASSCASLSGTSCTSNGSMTSCWEPTGVPPGQDSLPYRYNTATCVCSLGWSLIPYCSWVTP